VTSGGYVKFLTSGVHGDRVVALNDDGQRWRWWLLVLNADRMVFPGLMSNSSLKAYNELEIINLVYKSREWKSITDMLQAWHRDKMDFLEVGLIRSEVVFGDEYIWNTDWHVYQDKYSAKNKSASERFLKSWMKLSDKDRILFLHLMYTFRPTGVLEVFEDKAVERSIADVAEGKDAKALLVGADEWVRSMRPAFKRITETVTTALASNERAVNPNVKRLIDYFAQAYKKKFRKSYLVSWEKEGALVSKVLKGMEYEEATVLVDKFMEIEDPFLEKAGRTIGVFATQVNRLMSRDDRELEGGVDWSRFETE